jgi:hypothetical protein
VPRVTGRGRICAIPVARQRKTRRPFHRFSSNTA